MGDMRKRFSSFLLYFMIVAVFVSYYLFNKNGIVSIEMGKDLTFIFLMVVACFLRISVFSRRACACSGVIGDCGLLAGDSAW